MIGTLWGDTAARVSNHNNTTARFPCPNGDTGILDITVVRNGTGKVLSSHKRHGEEELVVAAAHVVSTCLSNVSIEITIASSPTPENVQPCSSVDARVLMSTSEDTVNSVANPANTVPTILDVSLVGTSISFVIPAGSLVVVPMCALS